jgi:hypothetical protein
MTALSELPGPDIAIVRKCRIEEVFPNSFIELIGLAPKNPCVRGMILAQTGKMPGSECETFEQIKEWVETTCDKKLRKPNSSSHRAGDGISITVDFSETEYGRAAYSVDRSGSGEFEIDADELVGMVQGAIASDEGLNTVIELIVQKIDDDAWDQCDPEMGDYGDYDYSDHETSDSENSQKSFSRNQVRDRMLAFLRERHPDLLEELQERTA